MMNNKLLINISLFIIFSTFFVGALKGQNEKIKWYSIEEAVELNKKNPKKIFIDFYTTWCGWCKRMDATTFSHPWIIKYMNKHFYPVKFNAETNKTITIGNKQFVNKNAGKKRGAHQFAIAILQGKMSYPSIAFLDEKLQLLFSVPGYRKPKSMETFLVWVATETYKNTSYEEFVKSYQNKVE